MPALAILVPLAAASMIGAYFNSLNRYKKLQFNSAGNDYHNTAYSDSEWDPTILMEAVRLYEQHPDSLDPNLVRVLDSLATVPADIGSKKLPREITGMLNKLVVNTDPTTGQQIGAWKPMFDNAGGRKVFADLVDKANKMYYFTNTGGAPQGRYGVGGVKYGNDDPGGAGTLGGDTRGYDPNDPNDPRRHRYKHRTIIQGSIKDPRNFKSEDEFNEFRDQSINDWGDDRPIGESDNGMGAGVIEMVRMITHGDGTGLGWNDFGSNSYWAPGGSQDQHKAIILRFLQAVKAQGDNDPYPYWTDDYYRIMTDPDYFSNWLNIGDNQQILNNPEYATQLLKDANVGTAISNTSLRAHYPTDFGTGKSAYGGYRNNLRDIYQADTYGYNYMPDLAAQFGIMPGNALHSRGAMAGGGNAFGGANSPYMHFMKKDFGDIPMYVIDPYEDPEWNDPALSSSSGGTSSSGASSSSGQGGSSSSNQSSSSSGGNSSSSSQSSSSSSGNSSSSSDSSSSSSNNAPELPPFKTEQGILLDTTNLRTGNPYWRDQRINKNIPAMFRNNPQSVIGQEILKQPVHKTTSMGSGWGFYSPTPNSAGNEDVASYWRQGSSQGGLSPTIINRLGIPQLSGNQQQRDLYNQYPDQDTARFVISGLTDGKNYPSYNNAATQPSIATYPQRNQFIGSIPLRNQTGQPLTSPPEHLYVEGANINAGLSYPGGTNNQGSINDIIFRYGNNNIQAQSLPLSIEDTEMQIDPVTIKSSSSAARPMSMADKRYYEELVNSYGKAAADKWAAQRELNAPYSD